MTSFTSLSGVSTQAKRPGSAAASKATTTAYYTGAVVTCYPRDPSGRHRWCGDAATDCPPAVLTPSWPWCEQTVTTGAFRHYFLMIAGAAVPNGCPNCSVLRLRDVVYASPYAAWIPTMPPSQGVVLPNSTFDSDRSSRPQWNGQGWPSYASSSPARRVGSACCARLGARARAGRPCGRRWWSRRPVVGGSWGRAPSRHPGAGP
jgi:hypothetical protein